MSKVEQFFSEWEANMQKRHPVQIKINDYILNGKITPNMNLREIGNVLGISHLQQVKYHLGQVKKKPLCDYNTNSNPKSEQL